MTVAFRIKLLWFTITILFVMALIISIVYFPVKDQENIGTDNKYDGKKVLYVNSYHKGYPWSDGIEKGIHNILADTAIELKTIYMDTKRNPEEEFIKQAALGVKNPFLF